MRNFNYIYVSAENTLLVFPQHAVTGLTLLPTPLRVKNFALKHDVFVFATNSKTQLFPVLNFSEVFKIDHRQIRRISS